MNTLYYTRGLPGSGKTTLAHKMVRERNGDIVAVSRDDIRRMLDPGFEYGDEGFEQLVTVVERATIESLLRLEVDVVVHDTNLRDFAGSDMRYLAWDSGADCEELDLTGVDVDECVRRDAKRDRPIGGDVIRDLHAKYIAPKTS